VDWKLELIAVPVSDVDRAKAFYTEQLGFNPDHDQQVSEELRFVQLTPPGSACSISIGTGITDSPPGSLQGLQLVVDDIEAAHAFLTERGIDNTGPQHFVNGQMTPGVEPDRADYGTFIYFDDPDGNSWAVQEVRHHAR
jgi:catechol 2,3-dioxygenase-like lactoylglutathione lyase family enzyme